MINDKKYNIVLIPLIKDYVCEIENNKSKLLELVKEKRQYLKEKRSLTDDECIDEISEYPEYLELRNQIMKLETKVYALIKAL